MAKEEQSKLARSAIYELGPAVSTKRDKFNGQPGQIVRKTIRHGLILKKYEQAELTYSDFVDILS